MTDEDVSIDEELLPMSPLRPEGELTDEEDFVALQATRFKPTTAVKNTRRAFLRRLNRIRTTYAFILAQSD